MSQKVLIATYSWSGTTQGVADRLAKLLPEADQYTIEVPAGTFSSDMYKTDDIAKQQIAANNYPSLVTPVPDVSQYETILVGSPVWSGKPASPVHTFLQEIQGFNGPVAAFYTDVGNAGDFESVFSQWAQGLDVKAAHHGGNDLNEWLAGLGLK